MRNIFMSLIFVIFTFQSVFAQIGKPVVEIGAGNVWTGIKEESGAFYTAANANIALLQKGNFNFITGLGIRATRLNFQEISLNIQEYDLTEWNVFLHIPLKSELYLPFEGGMQGIFTSVGFDFYYLLYRREKLPDEINHKTGKELFNEFIPAVSLGCGYDFSQRTKNLPLKITLTYSYEIRAQKGPNNFKNLGFSLGILF